MRIWKRQIIYGYLFLFPFLTIAQEVDFRFYTTQDGLSGSFTHGVLQDKKGFIWVYNDYKLHRFDGRVFELYAPPPYIAGSGEDIEQGLILQDSLLFSLGEKHLFLLTIFSKISSAVIPLIKTKGISLVMVGNSKISWGI